MKRLFALLLVLATMTSLFSCATEPKTTETQPITGETTQEETEENLPFSVAPQMLPGVSVKEKNYTQLKNALSWANICSYPIKRSDMTVQEMREACVNFFRYTKTAVWIPDETVEFMRTSSKKDSLTEGTVYGGLPYVSTGGGNIYRLLDYMDPQTGVVDMSSAIDIPEAEKLSGVAKTMRLFGNQCSYGAYWGWGRVINSANYGYTATMVQKNGFIKVGDYSYAPFEEDISKFTPSNVTTTKILAANGNQKMYECYAQLHLADGLVYYTTAGHVIMVSSEPVVVRNADGTIDGKKSYLSVIEQATSWLKDTNEAGDKYTYKSNVDIKMSFEAIFNGHYIPFTFAEFLGTDPVEETEIKFSRTQDTLSTAELVSGTVSCNYGISDVYVYLKDAQGKTEFVRVIRTLSANTKAVQLASECKTTEFEPYAGKGLTVEIVCQLATGERPMIYQGKLA